MLKIPETIAVYFQRNFPGIPLKTNASLTNTLENEAKINVYRRVFFIKTFMITNNSLKPNNFISIFTEFISLMIEILYIY